MKPLVIIPVPNDSSPPFSPLEAHSWLRMATTENSGLIVNDIPGAMMKVPVQPVYCSQTSMVVIA